MESGHGETENKIPALEEESSGLISKRNNSASGHDSCFQKPIFFGVLVASLCLYMLHSMAMLCCFQNACASLSIILLAAGSWPAWILCSAPFKSPTERERLYMDLIPPPSSGNAEVHPLWLQSDTGAKT